MSDTHSTLTPGNSTVNYGGSQQFNVTADSGYVSRVYVDGVDQGLLTSYNLTNIQVNHIISVTSEAVAPIGTSSPAPDKSPSTSPASSREVSQFPQTSGAPSPSQTPTSTTKTNKFPTETVLIAAAAIAATVALLALAFKKGYIAIEIADEETSGATTETAQNDYSI